MTDHTPGPWTVERESDKGGWKGIAIKAERAIVANVVMQLTENELANAKVIALAPELLDLAWSILALADQGKGNLNAIGHKASALIGRSL